MPGILRTKRQHTSCKLKPDAGMCSVRVVREKNIDSRHTHTTMYCCDIPYSYSYSFKDLDKTINTTIDANVAAPPTPKQM